MRTSFLRELYQTATHEVAERMAHQQLTERPPTPRGDPDMDDFLGRPILNPYAGMANGVEDLVALGPLTRPETCTLVLNVDPRGLMSALMPSMHRQVLPHMSPTHLSCQGLNQLAQAILEEAHKREGLAPWNRPRGGKP